MGRKVHIGLPDASNPTPATPDPTHTCIAHNCRVSKTKMEPYADNFRHTQMSSLQSGDHVLVKPRKLNKLTPPFNSKPYTVVRKQCSMVTAQCGKTLVMCHSSHFRHIKGDTLADDEEEEVQLQPLLPSQRASIVVETYGTGPAKISKHCPAKLRSPRLATPRRLHLSPSEPALLSGSSFGSTPGSSLAVGMSASPAAHPEPAVCREARVRKPPVYLSDSQ